MTDDEQRVSAPAPRNADGSVTVLTVNGVKLLLTCPTWCVDGHAYPHRVAVEDISHNGEPVWALSHTEEYGEAGHVEVSFAQWPYGSRPDAVLCVEAEDGLLELGPAGAREVARALREHAGTIAHMADQLETIRGAER